MAIDQSDAPNLAAYMYAARLGASDWSIAILQHTHLSPYATVSQGQLFGLDVRFLDLKLAHGRVKGQMCTPQDGN